MYIYDQNVIVCFITFLAYFNMSLFVLKNVIAVQRDRCNCLTPLANKLSRKKKEKSIEISQEHL